MSEASKVEPWLRGTHGEVPAVLRAVLHALELAEEDGVKWCGGLTTAELNQRPLGLSSLAHQLRHIAGSIDRLLTYAEGRELDAAQMVALRAEDQAVTSRDALLAEFRQALEGARQRVLAFSGVDPETPRFVGRKRLPTTVGGLLVHVADHTQRHVGQAVTTAKAVAALREA